MKEKTIFIAMLTLIAGLGAGVPLGAFVLAPRLHQLEEESEEKEEAPEVEAVEVAESSPSIPLPPTPPSGLSARESYQLRHKPGGISRRLSRGDVNGLATSKGNMSPSEELELLKRLHEQIGTLDALELEVTMREHVVFSREVFATSRERALRDREEALNKLAKELRAAGATSNEVVDITNEVGESGENPPPAGSVRAERVADLTKKVQAMKPEPAAALLAEVESHIAVDVLERLNSRSAGKILNKMPAAVAARLSEKLVARKVPIP